MYQDEKVVMTDRESQALGDDSIPQGNNQSWKARCALGVNVSTLGIDRYHYYPYLESVVFRTSLTLLLCFSAAADTSSWKPDPCMRSSRLKVTASPVRDFM